MKKILSLMLFILIIFSISGCEKKNEPAPQITKGEFPFVLEYEMDGKTYLIEDTVVCSFDGYDLSNPFRLLNSRTWFEYLKSGNEGKRVFIEFEANTESVFVKDRINEESRIILDYGFGGYYLGDPNDIGDGPCINYVESYKVSSQETHTQVTALNNKQLEGCFGIKIKRFEFSEPIKNTFE